MKAVNISLDAYGAVISAILFIYFRFGKRRMDRMDRCFMLMCAFSFTLAVGDIPSWACEGRAQSLFIFVQWAGALTFWLSSTLILLAFTAYLIEYIAPKARVNPRFFQAALALGAFHAAGIFLSLFNGMFFTVTPDSVYQRGNWFWLSQAIPFLIYGLDVAIFITYRKMLRPKDFSILTSYIALPLLCEAVQMFNYGIAPLCAGVSIALLIIFVNIQSVREASMERQEKELAEQRIDVMLSQIQPHFLYNALTAIRRLCDHDPQQAKTAISEFALFLRANMDSLKSKAPIPFEQELKHVESYLGLEKQRFGDRLRVVYDIECRDFSLPSLTIQPIVENAVRHGVLKRERGGTVTLRTAENADHYLIIIKDDGVGMAQAQPDGRSHIGIENVRSRLEAMCGGTMRIESTVDVGTTVVLTLPKGGAGHEISCGG